MLQLHGYFSDEMRMRQDLPEDWVSVGNVSLFTYLQSEAAVRCDSPKRDSPSPEPRNVIFYLLNQATQGCQLLFWQSTDWFKLVHYGWALLHT